MQNSSSPSALSAQLLVTLQEVLCNSSQRKAQQSLGCKQSDPAGQARECQRHCPHLQKDTVKFAPALEVRSLKSVELSLPVKHQVLQNL
jgi:hypothetical protein